MLGTQFRKVAIWPRMAHACAHLLVPAPLHPFTPSPIRPLYLHAPRGMQLIASAALEAQPSLLVLLTADNGPSSPGGAAQSVEVTFLLAGPPGACVGD